MIINGIIFALFNLLVDCLSELESMRKLHSTADEKIEANVEMYDLEEYSLFISDNSSLHFQIDTIVFFFGS